MGKWLIVNLMFYEIYDCMFNGLDFIIFKDEGVVGINNVFIGGFFYYYSLDDLLEWFNYCSV